MPCSVTSIGTPVTVVRVPHRAAERRRLDGRAHPVERRAGSGGGTAPSAVVPDALVVLHADEVVVAGQLEPVVVDLGPLAVATEASSPTHAVVDDGQGQARPAGRDARP